MDERHFKISGSLRAMRFGDLMTGELGAVLCSGVERADFFAARILRLAEPLRFSLARSHTEIENAHRLRYQTALARGWAAPEQFSSGLEFDEYDSGALQVIAVCREAVVGTARIVLPAPGRRLPIEKSFGLKLPFAAVEVGRVCRAQDRPDPCHSVFLGLLAQVWLEMRKRNFTLCCGAVGPSMVRLYRRMGLPVVLLARPMSNWGEERWPVVIRPSEASERLHETLNCWDETGGDSNEAIQP